MIWFAPFGSADIAITDIITFSADIANFVSKHAFNKLHHYH